jgi:hypothetical protein
MLCARSDQEVSTLALNFRAKCILFFEFLILSQLLLFIAS